MLITKRAIPLVLLVSLGISSAGAHGLQLADAGTPQWKDTGPVTKKKQKEVNFGG